jgi:hypothetical protein
MTAEQKRAQLLKASFQRWGEPGLKFAAAIVFEDLNLAREAYREFMAAQKEAYREFLTSKAPL